VGRFVYTVSATKPWEYKYGFASQCSNFAHHLGTLGSGVARVYRGADGEYVRVQGTRDEVLKAVEDVLDFLRELNACTICNQRKCVEYTTEMFEDFRKYIEDLPEPEVDVLLFSEYY
jgi:hypothetical protein